MSKRIKHFYEFGDFRFSPKEKCLWRNEELLQLSPKALEVLNLLLENPNEVVTREEILGSVWKDTFVDESNLTVAISNLRKVLGKKTSEKCIQTVPKKGYRFRAEIEEIFEDERGNKLNQADLDNEGVDSTATKAMPATKGGDRSGVRWHFVAIVMLGALFLTSFTMWLNYSGDQGFSSVPVNERNIKSIAVLPLKDIGEDSQSLSLGLAESLITRLAKLNRFAVRPLSSVDKFYESKKDAVDFGKELKVDAVLVGTIQNAENRLRVNVQLVDIRDGAIIWNEKFDEDEKGLFKLQDAISLRVAHSVLSQLTENEQKTIAKRTTNNREAYRLYLQGLENWLKRNDQPEGLRYFEKAASLDPKFALAHLGVADYYALAGDATKAEKALNNAINLDPDLHTAISTKGFMRMFYKWDWKGAEESLKKAIELGPNSSKAHHWYGVYLCFQKRFAEAESEMKKALELDPTSLVIATDIAELYYFQMDYDEAEIRLRRVLQIDKDFYPALGKQERVRRQKYNSSYPEHFKNETVNLVDILIDKENSDVTKSAKIEEYESSIKRNDKLKMFRSYLDVKGKLKLPDTNRYWYLSELLAVIGKNKESLDMLEKSLENREFLLPFTAIDPVWDEMRDNPRFRRIVRKMNLADSTD